MRQKLNLITLGVKDFKRSVQFYEDLGWKQSDKSMDGLALFPLGGITLAIHPLKELDEDVTVATTKVPFYGLTLSYNAKDEKEVDEVMTSVRNAGGSIVKPAQRVHWGGYSGYFADPDGYVIEVAHNPFWPMDENDNLIL